MRKSRKQTKKTNKNKRFSRNKRIKTKSNKPKIMRHKTRKIRGGYTEDDGHVLVGLFTRTPLQNKINPITGLTIPIFLSKNDNPNLYRILPFPLGAPEPYYNSHIILPNLYRLKNYRGLKLSDLASKNIIFRDENENPYFTHIQRPTNSDIMGFLSYEVPGWIRKNKDKIREVELKYPGLFERIYVTPEEEAEALREIERKESEKGVSKIEENQEIQDIKKTIEEMQKKMSGKEEIDEEKQATYSREMEQTNEMIPYLRAEQKLRKKNKPIKKIDDF